MTTDKYFNNIWELLADMQFRRKGDVLAADDPSMMRYGWIDVETEMYWKITVQDAQASLCLGDKHSIKILSDYFQDRKNSPIYLLLGDLPILQRMWKLRMFW